ncbi:MAG: hypothetical protein ACFFAT_13245 [Promethearchaeota archaeon]
MVLKKSLLKKFALSFSEIQKFQQFRYLLIIKSFTDKSIRITLYPLKNKDVIKLNIQDSDMFEDIFYKLTDFLKNYEIIHNSGLIEFNNYFIFECYLKLDLESPEINQIEKFLDNIKNSTTLFSIEKIKFKR